MSAASRTVQGTPSLTRLAIAFGAVALAVGLVLLLAFGRLGATKSQATPAAGAAPVQHDHGWSTASSQAATAPVQFDHGWSSASSGSSAAAGATGSGAKRIVVSSPRGGGIVYTGIPYPAPVYTGVPYPAPMYPPAQRGPTGSNHLRMAD